MNLLKDENYYLNRDREMQPPAPGTYSIKEDLVKPKVNVPIFHVAKSSPIIK